MFMKVNNRVWMFEENIAILLCKMSTAKNISSCFRLLSVVGHLGKVNDVIVCGEPYTSRNHVIYLGGDVQDYRENMQSHRDNKRYVKWNLEDTANLLYKKFPSSAIFVVRPSKMHLKTFSVYKNFVTSNDFGCPTHSSDEGAVRHLYDLYHNALSAYSAKVDSTCTSLKESQLILVGFSKGCIVLNQIVRELAGIIEGNDEYLKKFLHDIVEFYWLDGGHSGGKNTWVTDPVALSQLSQLKCKIHVHVTPYQVKDDMRSWIGKEEKLFTQTLKKSNADVSRILHFESEERCIENHFSVLEEFR